MSLAIDTSKVVEVLLVDGWHTVLNQSFTLDAFEFVRSDGNIVYAGLGGQGFQFEEFVETNTARIISGPATSVLAIRTKREP